MSNDVTLSGEELRIIAEIELYEGGDLESRSAWTPVRSCEGVHRDRLRPDGPDEVA